jgi:hypothetical protein
VGLYCGCGDVKLDALVVTLLVVSSLFSCGCTYVAELNLNQLDFYLSSRVIINGSIHAPPAQDIDSIMEKFPLPRRNINDSFAMAHPKGYLGAQELSIMHNRLSLWCTHDNTPNVILNRNEEPLHVVPVVTNSEFGCVPHISTCSRLLGEDGLWEVATIRKMHYS